MSVVARRTHRVRVIGIVVALVLLGACGVDPGVVSLSAAPTPSTDPSTDGAQVPADATHTAPDEPRTPPTSPTTTSSASTLPAIVEPELNVEIPLENVVDIDGAKPVRDYDEFLAVALTDIDQWWARIYPDVYGSRTGLHSKVACTPATRSAKPTSPDVANRVRTTRNSRSSSPSTASSATS